MIIIYSVKIFPFLSFRFRSVSVPLRLSLNSLIFYFMCIVVFPSINKSPDLISARAIIMKLELMQKAHLAKWPPDLRGFIFTSLRSTLTRAGIGRLCKQALLRRSQSTHRRVCLFSCRVPVGRLSLSVAAALSQRGRGSVGVMVKRMRKKRKQW